jgi:hypothetical protein
MDSFFAPGGPYLGPGGRNDLGEVATPAQLEQGSRNRYFHELSERNAAFMALANLQGTPEPTVKVGDGVINRTWNPWKPGCRERSGDTVAETVKRESSPEALEVLATASQCVADLRANDISNVPSRLRFVSASLRRLSAETHSERGELTLCVGHTEGKRSQPLLSPIPGFVLLVDEVAAELNRTTRDSRGRSIVLFADCLEWEIDRPFWLSPARPATRCELFEELALGLDVLAELVDLVAQGLAVPVHETFRQLPRCLTWRIDPYSYGSAYGPSALRLERCDEPVVNEIGPEWHTTFRSFEAEFLGHTETFRRRHGDSPPRSKNGSNGYFDRRRFRRFNSALRSLNAKLQSMKPSADLLVNQAKQHWSQQWEKDVKPMHLLQQQQLSALQSRFGKQSPSGTSV